MQKLLQALHFLELHRGYEGSGKALEQAKTVLGQAQMKAKTDFLGDVLLFSRYSRNKKSGAPASNENALLQATRPSDQEVQKASQLLKCILGSNFTPTQLLVEYGEKRYKLIQDFLKDNKHTNNM